jgi:large subunit ribosomal protein L20
MARSTSGPRRKKHVKKMLKLAKGARFKRSKNYRRAKETVQRALAFAYRDRRVRKREFRALWITRINAAARQRGLTYHQLIGGLKKHKIELSRDILSRLAIEEPKAFDALVAVVNEN